MTTNTLRATQVISAPVAAPAWLRGLAVRYLAWRHARTIVNELQGYSDRSLADMGIARGDIETIARNDARLVYGA